MGIIKALFSHYKNKNKNENEISTQLDTLTDDLEDLYAEYNTIISNLNKEVAIDYSNMLEIDLYPVNISAPPIIIEYRGWHNHMLTEEENDFVKHLTDNIKLLIPNALIKLSMKGPYICFDLFGEYQICRFEYNEINREIQIINRKTVKWIKLESIEQAYNLIYEIITYAKSLDYPGYPIQASNYISHLNLYFDCCYTVFYKDEYNSMFLTKADKQQFERYKQKLENNCPKNAVEFCKIKYTNPIAWETLKQSYCNKK